MCSTRAGTVPATPSFRFPRIHPHRRPTPHSAFFLCARTVREAFQLQQSISTAFTEENFGDYNEKTFLDIATADEMFEWMEGPLKDGLYPDQLYNGLPVPPELKGYVMVYNKVSRAALGDPPLPPSSPTRTHPRTHPHPSSHLHWQL